MIPKTKDNTKIDAVQKLKQVIIHCLPASFEGAGEVKGMQFQRIYLTNNAQCYEVNDEGKYHYEVFKTQTAPLCIDFLKRHYSETEFKEVYPKAKDFGVWAWTFRTEKEALKKINQL